MILSLGALRRSNTHFARCGSYRTGEVPLGDSISEADKQRQTTNRAYQCKLVVYTKCDDGPGRRLHFALDRRSASPIQPQITNYLILDPRECIYASLQCIFADAHGTY